MIVEFRKGMKANPGFVEIGSYWIFSPSVEQLKGDKHGHTTVVGLHRTLGHNTPQVMTRMTQNGVSTTQKGQEQYETFDSAHRGKRISRERYDYRTEGGELFSVVAPTLKECQQKRNEWLAKKK